MKIKQFLDQYALSDSKAFFISPKGEFIAGSSSHIDMVTDNPKKFGLSPEYIRKTYEKHNEMMGIEGKAREEILVKLITSGWIHIRRRPNKYWAVMIGRMSKKTQGFIYDWAIKILQGVHGVKELNKDAKVRIDSVNSSYSKEITVKEITQYRLQEEIEDLEYRLAICTINEMEEYLHGNDK